ncbi:MAG: sulfite exporter TauE/SafE family protein, partial [Deltaproteobacteria bacterium]|nr:sulfite exporter TauE/SafE family protein [Deltaproteobacteria bacterium]
MGFTLMQWAVTIICALLIGFTKAGIPGIGIIIPLLAASIMPAKESTGFVLPMLIMADLFAIIYWRRHVAWRQLLRLLPWSLIGIIAGSAGMSHITNEGLRLFIGLLVLGLMALSWIKDKKLPYDRIPSHWLFAAVLGFLAGATTMMANAAGPVMVIYLTSMRLPKEDFIGTSAWYFFIVNLLKLPFSHRLDLVTARSVEINFILLPFIIAGGLAG